MTDQGRVANPRPVATVKKLATGRVVQRQVLTRTVDHGETGFLGRSSDLDRSSGNEVRVYETGLGFVILPFIRYNNCQTGCTTGRTTGCIV